MAGCLGAILLFLFALVIDFLFSAGLVALVCWAFGWTFTWKIAFGLWIIFCILHNIFRSNSNKKS